MAPPRPDSLWALRFINARVVVQHYDFDSGTYGLIALVLDIATAVNAMQAGTGFRPSVVTSTIAAATLGHCIRMIADDKDESVGAVHPFLEGFLNAAGKTRVSRLM